MAEWPVGRHAMRALWQIQTASLSESVTIKSMVRLVSIVNFLSFISTIKSMLRLVSAELGNLATYEKDVHGC